MPASVHPWIKKQPVVTFYLLAFAITWAGWLPQVAYSRGSFPFDSPLFYILGGIGPGLAAYLVLGVLRGKECVGELFAPLWKWRVGAVWYAVALLANTVFWLAAIRLSGDTRLNVAPPGGWPTLLSTFLIAFFAAIPEEVGWRGFVLPRLQSRTSALAASLMIGVLSALWHIPLLLNVHSVMSSYEVLPYIVYVIALSVLYTWLYNSTRRSLLIVTLFHAASNTFISFIPASAIVIALAAIAVVIAFGPRYLCHQREHRTIDTEPGIAVAVNSTRR